MADLLTIAWRVFLVLGGITLGMLAVYIMGRVGALGAMQSIKQLQPEKQKEKHDA